MTADGRGAAKRDPGSGRGFVFTTDRTDSIRMKTDCRALEPEAVGCYVAVMVGILHPSLSVVSVVKKDSVMAEAGRRKTTVAPGRVCR
jgi:hypothetical protein